MSRQVASVVVHLAKKWAEAKGFMRVLDKVRFISAAEGRCVAEMTVTEEHQNPFGTLHGGLIATLVDQMSMFALSTHENGRKGVSIDMSIRFLKPAPVGQDIIIDAQTIRAGKTLAFLEVDVKKKETGELLARGSHTVFIGFPMSSKL